MYMVDLHLVRESKNGAGTYESHTVKVLKSMARARAAAYGVRGYSSLKKVELIALLRKHDKELAAAAKPVKARRGVGGTPHPRPPRGNNIAPPVRMVAIVNYKDFIARMQAAPGFRPPMARAFVQCVRELITTTNRQNGTNITFNDIEDMNYFVFGEDNGAAIYAIADTIPGAPVALDFARPLM